MKRNMIFGKYGNFLAFRDKQDMIEKLKSIELRVENLSSNIETERYYIINYCKVLVEEELLALPMEIEHIDDGKNESMPDFLVKTSPYKFFLEATMATTPELIIQLKEFRQKENENPSLKFQYFAFLQDDIVKIKLVEVSDKLMGRPILGSTSETIFAKLVGDSIIRKTKKILDYKVNADVPMELLIYYEFPPMGGVNYPDALTYLINYLKMKAYSNENAFHKIHLLKDNYLLYDILNKAKVIRY